MPRFLDLIDDTGERHLINFERVERIREVGPGVCRIYFENKNLDFRISLNELAEKLNQE
jgi:hypothetical protein